LKRLLYIFALWKCAWNSYFSLMKRC